jgi:hypothetical protein
LCGAGAIIIKGVPTVLKVSNTMLLFISLFIYILILRILRSIIKSIDQNDVFSILNARRLKKIGYLLLTNMILSYSIALINSLSFQSFDAYSIGVFIGLIIGEASGYLIAIAFTFFIAAVFKIGVNIQEENQSIV